MFDRRTFLERLHERLPPGVLFLTGGGSAALADLLRVPGGSRWLLDAQVPYGEAALTDLLAGEAPDGACSAATALALARRAAERAEWLAPGRPVFGLGSTAALASALPKKGLHRIHVALRMGGTTRSWVLHLEKDRRTRQEEEDLAAGLVLLALSSLTPDEQEYPPDARLAAISGQRLADQDRLEESSGPGDALADLLVQGRPVRQSVSGRLALLGESEVGRPLALLPGSFNPLHRAHLGLAAAARAMLGVPVAFELSVANVDKPATAAEEVRRRLRPFLGLAEVWVTRAPRFADKARLFPGVNFVVGVDTAARIVAPRYYDDDWTRMLDTLQQLREACCRFLVAGRVDGAGRFLSLAEVAVPPGFGDLFVPIPQERFRCDLSSTALRENKSG